MSRTLLRKENKKLKNENKELLNDISILISDKSNYIDVEMIKLKYMNKEEIEHLTWDRTFVVSEGLFNLIKNNNV